MAEKTNAQVLIGGKIFTLSGYESEEYLQKVAAYINGKLNELKESESFLKQPYDIQATLTELNIADDYFKAKKQLDILETEIETKDKEIYDLKHELISAQIKVESDEKTIAELREELSEIQQKVIKLEAELEDYKELLDEK
ncbi:MAG: cell division protein ZapA [Lachnospiraceae bacterium]|jgi:cell division protein ZapA|nr:cell division protein ZapA [Lachnospiraceae bacterium]